MPFVSFIAWHTGKRADALSEPERTRIIPLTAAPRQGEGSFAFPTEGRATWAAGPLQKRAGLGLSTGAEGSPASTESSVPAGETVPTRFHTRNLQSGCAGCWGTDATDPGGCQPPAPAEPTSPCPALRPFQQMGSSIQMLSLGSPVRGYWPGSRSRLSDLTSSAYN